MRDELPDIVSPRRLRFPSPTWAQKTSTVSLNRLTGNGREFASGEPADGRGYELHLDEADQHVRRGKIDEKEMPPLIDLSRKRPMTPK